MSQLHSLSSIRDIDGSTIRSPAKQSSHNTGLNNDELPAYKRPCKKRLTGYGDEGSKETIANDEARREDNNDPLL